MTCMICLVTISRSSSERCARRSARLVWSNWGVSGLPMPAALRLLARSCCITPESPASVEEEEAAQDTSSTSSRVDIKMTFPVMTKWRRRRKREISQLCQHSKAPCTKREGLPEVCVCLCVKAAVSNDCSAQWAGPLDPFIPKDWLWRCGLKFKANNNHWLFDGDIARMCKQCADRFINPLLSILTWNGTIRLKGINVFTWRTHLRVADH